MFQHGGWEKFTSAYREHGLVVQPDQSVKALEWAPGADGLALVGDFSESPLLPYGGIDARGPRLMCMFQSGGGRFNVILFTQMNGTPDLIDTSRGTTANGNLIFCRMPMGRARLPMNQP